MNNDNTSAWVVMAIGVVIVALLVWHFIHQGQINEEREHLTEIANYLDAQLDADGYYAGEDYDDVDRWGVPVGITYARNRPIEKLWVVSAGHDMEFNTDDDIVVVRRNVVPDAVGDAAGPPARQFMGGLWRGWKRDKEDDQ